MSVDAFPIRLADAVALSVLCQNSLTDAEVRQARAALHDLDAAWSLECCESCESDWFLDLSAACPAGRFDRFVIHAQDGAIRVFAMAGMTPRRSAASRTWRRPRVPSSRRSRRTGDNNAGRDGGAGNDDRRQMAELSRSHGASAAPG